MLMQTNKNSVRKWFGGASQKQKVWSQAVQEPCSAASSAPLRDALKMLHSQIYAHNNL